MDKDTFLNKIVLGWIKRDFERMLSGVPVIPKGEGNINFFLALCALATMEFLGSFLLGKKVNFEKNVEEYVNRCFNNPDEYPICILREVFRNGLAHEFFPRGIITRDGTHPAVFLDTKTSGVVLDAETLVNDLLDSLDNFKNELEEEKYKERMEQLEKQLEESRKKCKEEIKNIPKKGSTSTTSSSSEVTSPSSDTISGPPELIK
ncbi:MAG: hypothetical protein ACKKMO_01490 [Candidatus Nealsonbacteria bacterium]